MMKNNTINSFIVSALVGVVGCSDEPKASADLPQANKQSEMTTVLAEVNGEYITEFDLQTAVNRTFSEADRLHVNSAVQEKLLQSLVVSRAIMQTAKNSFNAQDKSQIEARVQAFREELYVKSYLQKHVTPKPVSTEMVKDYYERNPEEFGAITQKEIEILTMAEGSSESDINTFLENVPELKNDSNWSSLKKVNGLRYRKAMAGVGLISPELETVVINMTSQDKPSVVMVNTVPHLVRVIGTKHLPAKPLSEVSASIRKKLAPIQLKVAVKDLSDRVLSNTKVEYR